PPVSPIGAPTPAASAQEPVGKGIPADEPAPPTSYRRVLVGPGHNEPEPYPGYTGFVGWQGVTRTRTGALLVTFTSGYWHGSPPTPFQGISPGHLEALKKAGMPTDVDAPRGGRAEIMRSEDGGRTWTAPEPLIE